MSRTLAAFGILASVVLPVSSAHAGARDVYVAFVDVGSPVDPNDTFRDAFIRRFLRCPARQPVRACMRAHTIGIGTEDEGEEIIKLVRVRRADAAAVRAATTRAEFEHAIRSARHDENGYADAWVSYLREGRNVRVVVYTRAGSQRIPLAVETLQLPETGELGRTELTAFENRVARQVRMRFEP